MLEAKEVTKVGAGCKVMAGKRRYVINSSPQRKDPVNEKRCDHQNFSKAYRPRDVLLVVTVKNIRF